MMALRFANGLFEPLWNRNFIDTSRSPRPRTSASARVPTTTSVPVHCGT